MKGLGRGRGDYRVRTAGLISRWDADAGVRKELKQVMLKHVKKYPKTTRKGRTKGHKQVLFLKHSDGSLFCIHPGNQDFKFVSFRSD